MNFASLNDIAITIAGIVGIAIFYFIGKREAKKRERAKKK